MHESAKRINFGYSSITERVKLFGTNNIITRLKNFKDLKNPLIVKVVIIFFFRCVCVGQRSTSSIFSHLFLPYFLRQGLSLKPELTDQLDCLNGKALGLLAPTFSVGSQHAPLHLAFMCVLGLKVRSWRMHSRHSTN